MPDLRTALTTALSQSKEKHMTDPKELHKIIDSWNDEKPAQELPRPFNGHGRIINNISRITFETVRDNPNRTVPELTAIITKRGLKASSVSSLINQMQRNGMVTRSKSGRISTHLKEYQPIKNLSQIKKAAARQGIVSLPRNEKIEMPAPTPAVVAAPAPRAFDADAMLSTLSFKDAVTLFLALQKMFNSTREV
jgi:transcriptional/translational regulatory protein YebC/TACO1